MQIVEGPGRLHDRHRQPNQSLRALQRQMHIGDDVLGYTSGLQWTQNRRTFG